MNDQVRQLWQDLQNEDARYAYAETITNAFIAAQIKGLREARNLSQEQLAELIGTKQSGISRLERADYSTWKVDTLRRLARAFGVRLRIRFEPFGTLLDERADFSDESLLPSRFEDDPVFTDIDVLARANAPNSEECKVDNGVLFGNEEPTANKEAESGPERSASPFTHVGPSMGLDADRKPSETQQSQAADWPVGQRERRSRVGLEAIAS